MIAVPQKETVIKMSMTNGEFVFLYLTCPDLDYKSLFTPGRGNEAVSFIQTNFAWRFEPATPQTWSEQFTALLPSLTFTTFIIDTYVLSHDSEESVLLKYISSYRFMCYAHYLASVRTV